ncbi:DUF4136 domain-containing protein [Bacteroides salyersiae]|uniref:DUF4136 domain-containing protein n=1 Tax=Bacteroides salyersiae TaxID=291644 RepID=UPI001897101C|nr:DUF4136 domain-containing protein [Bacteroides salyersiae]
MKKWILISLMALAFCSCEEEHGLDGDFLVYTNYDTGADFSGYETFFIPDSILLVGDSEKPDYLKGTVADAVIRSYVENMEGMGYTRTDRKGEADLGIQLTLIDDTRHFVGYTSSC